MRAEWGLLVSISSAPAAVSVTSVLRVGGRMAVAWPGGSAEQEVREARLGPVDEVADLAAGADQRGSVRIGGLPQRHPAVAQRFGLDAVAAVAAAPGLAPSFGAEVDGGVADVTHG